MNAYNKKNTRLLLTWRSKEMTSFLREKSDPELVKRMISEASTGLSKDDIQAQKISYIYGSVGSESAVTKTDVEAYVKRSQGF